MEHQNGNGTTTTPAAHEARYSAEAIFREECKAHGLSESTAAGVWSGGMKADGELGDREIVGVMDEQAYRFLCRSVLLGGQAETEKRAAKEKEALAASYGMIATHGIVSSHPGACVVPVLSTGQVAKCKHDHDADNAEASEEQSSGLKIASLRIPRSLGKLLQSLANGALESDDK